MTKKLEIKPGQLWQFNPIREYDRQSIDLIVDVYVDRRGSQFVKIHSVYCDKRDESKIVENVDWFFTDLEDWQSEGMYALLKDNEK